MSMLFSNDGSRGRVPAGAAAFFALGLIISALFSADTLSAGAQSDLRAVKITDDPAATDLDLFSGEKPAKGKFLVASRALSDPRFQESVVLLIAYGPEGAAGLIINRPTKVPLAEMLPSVPGMKQRADVIYYGGPVEGSRILMLIRSDKKPEESNRVFADVYFSASKNTLERMIVAHKPEKQFRNYAGSAGWFPGQLDGELLRGDWIVVRADAGSIFEKNPAGIWRELFRRGSAIQVRNCDNPYSETH